EAHCRRLTQGEGEGRPDRWTLPPTDARKPAALAPSLRRLARARHAGRPRLRGRRAERAHRLVQDDLDRRPQTEYEVRATVTVDVGHEGVCCRPRQGHREGRGEYPRAVVRQDREL